MLDLADQIPFLTSLPKELQTIILNILLFVIAMLAIWVLRNILSRIIMAPLRRAVGRTSNDLDDRALKAVERPMRVLVLGIGIALVATIFNFTATLDHLADVVARALVIASVVFFFYNLVDLIGFSSQTLNRLTGIQIEERLLPFLRTVLKVFIVVMGLLIILQEFGYNVTGLIASFGVVGLAFSLAAQDTAANVFGFAAIVSDNPFQVGDYIVTPDFSGVVEHVGVRSTRVRKLDQALVTVPNAKLSDAAVTNWSRLDKRRLDFYIGLTYATTSDQMREVLQRLRDMLRNRDTVDPDSVIVHFVNFGDSSLDIRIIAYLLLPDWAEYTAETELINLDVMQVVESVGLSMAFPSRSLYLESVPGSDTPAQPVPLSPMPAPSEPTLQPDNQETEVGQSEERYQDNPSASSDDGGDE